MKIKTIEDVQDGMLYDLVYEQKQAEAKAINESGLKDQIAFLKSRGLSEYDIIHYAQFEEEKLEDLR
jgi:hypothetical protein